MNQPIDTKTIESKLVKINDVLVLLDKDVAFLYGIETKVLNQNIKKNIDLFPKEFRFQLTQEEYDILRSSEMTLKKGRGQHRKYLPYVFTEEGLYMVATILRSEMAKHVHFHIVKTFTMMRQFSKAINQITKTTDQTIQNKLAKKSSQILETIIEIEEDLLNNDGEIIESETRFEFNLGVAKIVKNVKKVKSKS